MASEVVLPIAVMMDGAGNWIAFGRSDNWPHENEAVTELLAAKFLASEARIHQVECKVTIPTEAADG